MAARDSDSPCPVGLGDFLAVAKRFQDVPELKFLQSPNDVVTEHISRGDVNYNFRCSSKEDPSQAVFIKHAAPYCKSVPSLQLSAARLATEYHSMVHVYRASPQSVAKPLCFSKDKNIAMFEFLGGYEDYEVLVLAGKVNQQTVTALAKSLGQLHHSTHVNTLSEDRFTELKSQVGCKEIDEETGNFYFEGWKNDEASLRELKRQHVQKREEVLNDAEIQAALSRVKQYTESEDCLVHNDLHFNSIMVKDNTPKLIDFEFARVGNPARDVGLVVSMSLAMYYYHLLCPVNNDHHRRIAYKLLESVTWFMEVYYEHMTAYGGDAEGFKRRMAQHVSGFAGTELVLRVLSTPHIPSIQGATHVADAETAMLDCGLRLLRKQQQIESIDKMLFIGLMLC